MSNPDELWQLYDKQGLPLVGEGATKDDTYGQGLLRSAAHVWIYRRTSINEVEILLQKRAATKRTWPNCYDISAAGHIDLGEDPLVAAIRETEEEIGYSLREDELQFAGVQRQRMATPDGQTENELCWLYLMELSQKVDFTLADGEVATLEWKPMSEVKQKVLGARHSLMTMCRIVMRISGQCLKR